MTGLDEGVRYLVVVSAKNRLGSSRRAIIVVCTLGTTKPKPVDDTHPVNACKLFSYLSSILAGSHNISFFSTYCVFTPDFSDRLPFINILRLGISDGYR